MDLKYDNSRLIKTKQSKNSKVLSADVFFKKGADTTVRLCDGQILRFNKGALCCSAGSEVLNNIFFGELKEEETKIDDIDYDTFNTFVECVMGYKNLSFEKAFKIFPVVHKYQCEGFIDECIKFLKPEVMSERVCDLLNMAVLYSPQSDKLTENIVRFIGFNNFFIFLENEEYCHLLEPDALKLILNNLDIDQMIDSVVLKAIVNWGKNYLEKNSINDVSLKDFFQKRDLLKFFQLESFETTGEVSDFCSKEGKDIFSPEEVLYHFPNLKDLTHGVSKWVKMNQDQSITEQIFLGASKKSIHRPSFGIFYMSIKVERNKVVFYNVHETEKKANSDSDSEPSLDRRKRKRTNRQDHSSLLIFTDSDTDTNTDIDTETEIIPNTEETLISCKISFTKTNQNGQRLYTTEDTAGFSYLDFETIFLDFLESTRYPNSELSCSITWTFLEDCRILLTNKPGWDKSDDSDKMYFTKNITACF